MKKTYYLSECEIKTIKSALKAHTRHCKEFIETSNSLTALNKIHVENKIEIMENLLKNFNA